MKAVVGLGNPGREYANTPHSIGFEVIDHLSAGAGSKMRRSLRFGASTGRTVIKDTEVLLVKPQTYMNASGPVVSAILRYYKIEASDMIVVLDDADLEAGQIRIRPAGSAGGHRGLMSVTESVGTEHFVRVRIGIGRGAAGVDLVRHVLAAFTPAERLLMNEVVKESAEAVLNIISSGAERAMNKYNATRIGKAGG